MVYVLPLFFFFLSRPIPSFSFFDEKWLAILIITE